MIPGPVEEHPRKVDRDIFGRPPRRTPDWSHRRGEPRVFALLWTGYLMTVTLILFARAGISGPASPESLRPGVRLALWMMLAGICVLWPLVRLSQVFPARGAAGAALKDLAIVLIPAQAIIWPQVWLCRWPLEVVACVASVIGVWSMMIGGILSVAYAAAVRRMSPASGRGRVAAMVVCVALAVASAAVVLAGTRSTERSGFRPMWMASPMTAIAELTTDRAWTGRSAATTRSHWRVLGVLASGSAGLWIVAAGLERLGRKGGKP